MILCPESPPDHQPTNPIVERAIKDFMGDQYLPVGTSLSGNTEMLLSIDQLLRQTLVVGRTGTGKSRFLQLLIGQLFRRFIPVFVLDPGDLVDAVLCDIAAECERLDDDAPLKRVHLIEPRWNMIIGLDAFDAFNIPADDNAYAAWLPQRVEQMVQALLRSQGETSTDGMPRLERILRNMLTVIGTPGPNGKRLPLGSIFILFDFNHRDFDPVWALVSPRLDPAIRADFLQMHGLKDRPDQLLKFTESTLNRCRSFLTPIVKAIYSDIEQQCFNLHTALFVDRGIVLCRFAATEFFGIEQGDILGRVMNYQLFSMVRAIPESQRLPCIAVIDEFHRYLLPDMLDFIAEGRRYGLAMVLATQDLLRLNDVIDGFDRMILNMVDNVIAFQQRVVEDFFADVMWRPNYSYEEQYVPHMIPVGFTKIPTVATSVSNTQTTTYSQAMSRATQSGHTYGRSQSGLSNWMRALGFSGSTSDGKGHVDSAGHTDSAGHSDSQSFGDSIQAGTHSGTSPMTIDGMTQWIPTSSTTDGTGVFNGGGSSDSSGSADSVSAADSKSHSISSGVSVVEAQGGGSSYAEVISESGSSSQSLMQSQSTASSSGKTLTYSEQVMPLHDVIYTSQGLRTPIDVQRDKGKSILCEVPNRCCVVRADGVSTDIMVVDAVGDCFPDARYREWILEHYKQKIFSLHPYFRKPDFSPAAIDQASAAFLAQGQPLAVASQVVPAAPPASPSHPF